MIGIALGEWRRCGGDVDELRNTRTAEVWHQTLSGD